MKIQSADTHPDAERMLIHLIRTAPMSKRFRLIQSLTQGAFWSNIQAWRQSRGATYPLHTFFLSIPGKTGIFRENGTGQVKG